MTRSLFDFFKEQDVEFYRSFDVSHISSIGIGAVCDFAVYPHSEDEFLNIISFLESNGLKYFVAGRMTNVLVCTKEYHGVVVFTAKMNGYNVAETMVSAECGANFSSMLAKNSSLSLGGYENLFGIPGSVGGMIYNNAGAYGMSVSDCFVRARLYSLTDHNVVTFLSSKMNFSYRKSITKKSAFFS